MLVYTPTSEITVSTTFQTTSNYSPVPMQLNHPKHRPLTFLIRISDVHYLVTPKLNNSVEITFTPSKNSLLVLFQHFLNLYLLKPIVSVYCITHLVNYTIYTLLNLILPNSICLTFFQAGTPSSH